MENKQTYNVVEFGHKAKRRDYSKVSGSLDLPNLVEIQTNAFDWFKNEGIKEVFEEIYPIQNHSESIKLNFLKYEFGTPKFSASECKIREVNYAAPIKATMELNITDRSTGEVIQKTEEVFLGDFPLMTDTGTFIINGAERVIVSQIVRSPGAYFSMPTDDRTGKDLYESELIPSRGTWLEFMSDAKKSALGRVFNMKVDRKRAMLSSVLFKAFGMSLNLENGEDALNDSSFKTFMASLNLPVYEGLYETESENREFLSMYTLLYTGLFGNYDEVVNTLVADKTKTTEEALRAIYENQRSDEIPTLDGAISLMNAKFLDYRRYDLTKAGRYKLHKKLEAANRVKDTRLAQDVLDVNGNVVFTKGTLISRRQDMQDLRAVLKKGGYMQVAPLAHVFSHPDVVSVSVDDTVLVGRVLAKDVVTDDYSIDQGTVLTDKEIALLSGGVGEVSIYASIAAKPVQLTPENIRSVLNYGHRLYSLGRLVDAQQEDVYKNANDIYVDRYIPDTSLNNKITAAQEDKLVALVAKEPLTMWLIGAAVQELFVYPDEHDNHIVKILGIDPLSEKKTITVSDIIANYSYILNLMDGLGEVDDIDQLGNRRVRTIGELIQNQFRIGLSRMERVVKERMSITDYSALTPKTLTNIRPLTAAIKEFFSSSQLSQFMDQTNPLAELTNKRRISALGPGGITRDRASYEVRDVHSTHYGRICPIETPEGPNIGLISNLTSYAKVNEYGFIQTPYRIVKSDGTVTENVVYLSADDELDYVIAQANEVIDHQIVHDQVVVRYKGENILAPKDTVELADVSPKQIVSVATACIPFLENDDASRALMGANMQRQAIPLLNPQSPYVGTGIEHRVAKDSGSAMKSAVKGIVTYVDANKIIINDGGADYTHDLIKFKRSNNGTSLNQHPIVDLGERVERGDIIADGPSMQNGELALGQNVVVAFTTWNGYNYEDAVIMSERLVKDDVYTSIHIEQYDLEVRETKLGPEEITRDIPNVSENACRHLDARGIVMVGAEVKEGDILVGKVTPKGQSEISPEEKLLLAIFGEKSREVRDNSLKVPHGGSGIVQSVRIFKREEGHDLAPGVKEVVKVYIVQKRKISEGDKMAGRHGNKGVISRIMPAEDMPYLPDGTPVDIMLNPQGVPSRMNFGQVLEFHLGYAAKKLGVKFATSVFDGINNDELASILKEAGVSEDGKTVLYDGRTGEAFDERISVGVMYMIKLAHMVDDKLHARATGPYSLVTQQPLGGKAQNGGQRFGEMEVWALYAYGAANTLQEIMTIKSDDVVGRTKTYAAIQNGKDIPKPGIPESFRVLTHELQALGLDFKLLDENDVEIDMKKAEGEEVKELADLEINADDSFRQDLLSIDDEDSENLAEPAVVGFDDEQ